MLGAIRGTVLHKDLQMLIVEAGGVGYKVFTTTDTSLDAIPGTTLSLWLHTAVRENSIDLYGFKEREALELFELLINCVPGIGPKTALGILNVASPAMLRQAVATEDTSYLVKVSGIGKKNAEKIVLELKGKLVTTAEDMVGGRKGESDVVEALLSLGYSDRDIREALREMPQDLESTSDRVKYALKTLARNG